MHVLIPVHGPPPFSQRLHPHPQSALTGSETAVRSHSPGCAAQQWEGGGADGIACASGDGGNPSAACFVGESGQGGAPSEGCCHAELERASLGRGSAHSARLDHKPRKTGLVWPARLATPPPPRHSCCSAGAVRLQRCCSGCAAAAAAPLQRCCCCSSAAAAAVPLLAAALLQRLLLLLQR